MENLIEISDRAQQYYEDTKSWVSDLKFLKIENDFFHHLQLDYFVELADQKDLDQLKEIFDKLLKLKLTIREADMQCSMQLERLALIVDNTIPEDISYLSLENNKLFDLMQSLTKDDRDIKLGLFYLVEKVKDTRKLLLD